MCLINGPLAHDFGGRIKGKGKEAKKGGVWKSCARFDGGESKSFVRVSSHRSVTKNGTEMCGGKTQKGKKEKGGGSLTSVRG